MNYDNADISQSEEELIRFFQENFKLQPQTRTTSDVSIQFQKLTIQRNVAMSIIKQQQKHNQPSNHSLTIIYAFIFSDQKMNWEAQLSSTLARFNIQASFSLFSKPKNQYIIAKIYLPAQNGISDWFLCLAEYLLLQQSNTQCEHLIYGFRPSFYLSSHVGKEAFEWKEESANVKRVMISGKETDVYLCGVVLEQEENEDLEFKSLKSELMIKNPEIVQKQICSFLNKKLVNRQEKEAFQGRILIGVSQDQKLQKAVVCGCSCSERKELRVVTSIKESLKSTSPAIKNNLVNLKVCPLGVLDTTSGLLHLVKGLKIFVIEMQYQDEVVYGTQSNKFLYREGCNASPIPLALLYKFSKEQKLQEETFLRVLNAKDQEQQKFDEQQQQQSKKKQRFQQN